MPAKRPACASRVRAARVGSSACGARTLAEAFLDGGVASFVGTHWPVGDDAALAFSTVFYERLLDGLSLGGAMLAARRRVFELGSIDWADYVHYGNPAFRLANEAT
jgi:CHAT domain-containing protein